MSDKQTITIMVAGEPSEVCITKSTTCDDVIRTLVSQKLTTNDMSIVQRLGDVEKRVSGKTKILKLVRSTGATKSNVILVVQQMEVNKSDRHVFRQLKAKVQRVKSKFSKSREGSNLLENMVYGSTTDTTYVSKNLKVEMLQDPTINKLAIMKRYMEDVMTYSPRPSERRSRDDGVSFCNRLEGLVSVRGDIDMLEDTYVDDLGKHSDMNEAFLNESLNDTVTEINTDLNVCMINEDCFSEAESAFDDDSDTESVTEFDKNVFAASVDCNKMSPERIRKLFGLGEIPETSMDSVLESFMNTLIQQTHQSDDEGISSMGSDLV